MRLSINEEPNSDENFLAELSTPALLEVADLYLVQYDIILAQKYASTVLQNCKNEDPDPSFGRWIAASVVDQNVLLGKSPLIIDDNFHSLWWMALILYARCFIGGNRINLNSDDVFNDATDRVNHKYFWEMRSKHIAHPINNLEISKPFVQLPPIN
jgi:hypothetical protein